MTRPDPIAACGLACPSAQLLRHTLTVVANGGMGDPYANATLWHALKRLRRIHGSLGAARRHAGAQTSRRNADARGGA